MVGERIGTLLAGVAIVAAHPVPFDLVWAMGQKCIELLPQVDVFNRLARGRFPAFGLPPLHPFGDAFAHVLAVHINAHTAWALKRLERLNDSRQLHTVVGGERFTATEFFGHSA